jgi:hypothetical protein
MICVSAGLGSPRPAGEAEIEKHLGIENKIAA